MKIFIAVFIFFYSLSFAQKQNEINQVKHVIDLAFNFDFTKADSILKKSFAEKPDQLKNYFMFLTVGTIKTMKLRYEAPAEFKRGILDSMNTVLLKKAEEAIDKFEDENLDNLNKLFLGGIYGYAARIKGVQREWYDAFSMGKSGINLYEDILDSDPGYSDAHLLLGMSEYYSARLSGFAGFITSLLGMGGERDSGLRQIKIAADKAKIVKPQAILLLAEIYSRMEDNSLQSLPYFESIIKSYPDNNYVLNWYARECLDADQFDKVRDLINGPKSKQLDNDVLANYYSAINEIDKSEEYIKLFEKNSSTAYGWTKRRINNLKIVNLLLQNKMTEFQSAYDSLSQNQQKYFSAILELKQNFSELNELKKLVGLNDPASKGKFEFYKRAKLPQKVYGFIQYLEEIYFFKQKNYSGSENCFQNAMKNNPALTEYGSIQYLMKIYLLQKFPKGKVEALLELIENNDYETLEFAFSELRSMYDL